MTKADTWIGLILIGVALAALIPAWQFASVPGMQFGAWTFPVFVVAGLGLCGAILTIKSLTIRDGDREPVSGPAMTSAALPGFALVIAACLFYIVAAGTLGFLITASLIVLSVSLYFWRRPLACILLTLIAVPVAELIFATGFSVPLPRGLLSVAGLV